VKLAPRITGAALLLTCLPLIGMAFLTFDSARRSLHEALTAHLNETAASQLDALRHEIDGAFQHLALWSQDGAMQDVLTDDIAGDLGAELRRFSSQSQLFAALFVLNDRGIVVASSDERLRGRDFARSRLYRASAAGQAVQLSAAAYDLGAPGELVLVQPIAASYDAETLIGTLAGTITKGELAAVLARQTLLGHSQSETHRVQFIHSATGSVLYDSLNIAQNGDAGGATSIAVTNLGDNYLYGHATIDAHQWVLRALLAREVADNLVAALRGRYLTLGLFFLLAACTLGLTLTRSLLRPIVALQVAAQRLAAREFNAELPPARADEIGDLTRGFMVLREAIKAEEHKRNQSEARIRRLAYHDPLTGLANRAYFEDFLHNTIASATRNGGRAAVIYFDLDYFKRINDTLGHHAGDLLLQGTADRLRRVVRGSDCVARSVSQDAEAYERDEHALVRFGGDEFIAVLSRIEENQDAARVAQRLLDSFGEPFKLDSEELYVTPSIGIALYPDDGVDAETLLRNADAAMYEAKQAGRNGYRFYFREMNERARARLSLENNLRKAIERGEFRLHYQPQVDLRSSSITGVEALVRWDHPERGLISPMEFIPLAEDTGLIVPLGEQILGLACAQLRAWRDTPLADVRVAVNLSLRQVREREFSHLVATVLAEHGLRPNQIELELTESTLMEESERSTEILARLSELGTKLSIDDFGTGYSSLSYLKRLSISTLKIDRSFVRDLEHDANDEAIVTAIIAMSHKLNLEVVAEGVETLAQAALLRRLGCDLIQGYWLSPPLAANDLLRFASQPIKVLEQLARPALTVLDSNAAPGTAPPSALAREAVSA